MIYIGKMMRKTPDPKYLGSGIRLKVAIKKYGKEKFKRTDIDYALSKEELCEKEKFWIKFYNSKDRQIGYNLTDGGDGHTSLHSEKTKDKMRKSALNRDPSTRGGYKLSNDACEKIRERMKNRIISEETRKKLSIKMKNKRLSKEHREKLSNLFLEKFKDKTKHPQFGKKRPDVADRWKRYRENKINAS